MAACVVFKICPRPAWEEAIRLGFYDGSAVDRRDGFIHLSERAQVEETAARHFSGQRDLVLIALDAAALAASLRYEPSRGGMLFPHYYGALPVGAALWVEPLGLDRAGDPQVPKRFHDEPTR